MKLEQRDNMLDGMKREIILDHYQNPRNRGLVEDNTYIKADTNNESCIDEIHLMVKIENDTIVDARFDGEACAICTSATSIMIDTIIGKKVKEAIQIYENFHHMLNEEPYDAEVLEQAFVYDDIYKQPNRKKCALLPWWGFEKVINQYQNKD